MVEWTKTSRKAGNVAFTACSLEGNPFELTLENVSIPFEPSAFGDDGTATRKSVCFEGAAEDIKTKLANMEENIGATSSCLKDSLLRCKIDMNKYRAYDAQSNSIENPTTWRGQKANVHVHIRGKWQTSQGCGLSLETTNVQFMGQREPTCPFKPVPVC